MGLQEFWFILLAALFCGFFVLEGFDFGVGMLMHFFGRRAKGDPEKHRRAVLNTIGPVWDGNEVWLITAGGAMFAAFPGMYATVFSGLYLPLLLILVAMILRVCAIEWRGKIDDPRVAVLGRHRHRGGVVAARLPVGRGFRLSGARASGGRRSPDASVHRRCAQRVHPARRCGDDRFVPVLRGGVRRTENRRRGA